MTKKENEFTSQVCNDLQRWYSMYKDVENLPIEFYNHYKLFLERYKNEGFSQNQMMVLLTNIHKENTDIAEFVYEILDLVLGHCILEYRVFLE